MPLQHLPAVSCVALPIPAVYSTPLADCQCEIQSLLKKDVCQVSAGAPLHTAALTCCVLPSSHLVVPATSDKEKWKNADEAPSQAINVMYQYIKE